MSEPPQSSYFAGVRSGSGCWTRTNDPLINSQRHSCGVVRSLDKTSSISSITCTLPRPLPDLLPYENAIHPPREALFLVPLLHGCYTMHIRSYFRSSR
jgi:hypothetical protein